MGSVLVASGYGVGAADPTPPTSGYAVFCMG